MSVLFRTIIVSFILFSFFLVFVGLLTLTNPKKLYITFILYGNMNDDCYIKSALRHDFPIIFDNLLYFNDAHPDFKGQVQLSGQTFLSLQIFATHVVDHTDFHG